MKESISEGTVALGAQLLLAAVCGLVLQVVVGRLLGPEGYGAFSVAGAVLYTTTAILLMGVPLAVARLTAEHEDRAAVIRSRAIRIQGVAGILAGAVLWGVADALASHLKQPALAAPLRAGALSLPLVGIAQVFVQQLNGLRRFRSQAVAMSSFSVARALAMTLPIALGGSLAGAYYGLSAAAVVFVVTAWSLRDRRPVTEDFSKSALVKLGLTFTITSAAAAVWGQVDILMLQGLGRYPADAGLFTAASTLVWAPAAPFAPFLQALFPNISRAAATGPKQEISRALEKSLLVALLALYPVAIGAPLAGPSLIALLYGKAFAGAGAVLAPLAVGITLFTLYEVFDTALRAGGHAMTSMVLTLFLIGLHVALNLVLIPLAQLEGAALSVALVSVAASASAALLVGRSLRIRFAWRSAARGLAIAAIAFAPMALWGPPPGLITLAVAAASLGAYVVAMRWLEPELAAELAGMARSGAKRLWPRARQNQARD